MQINCLHKRFGVCFFRRIVFFVNNVCSATLTCGNMPLSICPEIFFMWCRAFSDYTVIRFAISTKRPFSLEFRHSLRNIAMRRRDRMAMSELAWAICRIFWQQRGLQVFPHTFTYCLGVFLFKFHFTISCEVFFFCFIAFFLSCSFLWSPPNRMYVHECVFI